MTDTADNPSQNQPTEPEEFQPVAAVLAWVLPGLGHAYLGDLKRGLLVGGGVMFLFLGGLLVGGIDSVDSGLFFSNKLGGMWAKATGSKFTPEKVEGGDPVWFLGQIFVGPIALGVDYVHQRSFKVRDPSTGALRGAWPDESRDPTSGLPMARGPGSTPPNVRALARVGEIGTLSCTVAGMMNLIAMIDAGFNRRRRKPGGRA